jgi:hypothetical protein
VQKLPLFEDNFPPILSKGSYSTLPLFGHGIILGKWSLLNFFQDNTHVGLKYISIRQIAFVADLEVGRVIKETFLIL